MSTNKFKYWEVSTTQIVKALNKSDAIAAVQPRRTPVAKILGSEVTVERISAIDAHTLVAQTV